MNIGELREVIKNLPHEMEVVISWTETGIQWEREAMAGVDYGGLFYILDYQEKPSGKITDQCDDENEDLLDLILVDENGDEIDSTNSDEALSLKGGS